MTREQIEKIIERGGLTEKQQGALWECLIVESNEVQEILDHVKGAAQHPFIYPMFVFAAHTGARRSEIVRSQVDDFDFQSRTVQIREKKRDHDKSLTYRRVQMSDLLVQVMQEWFSQHPGGQFTICEPVKIMRGNSGERQSLFLSHARGHVSRVHAAPAAAAGGKNPGESGRHMAVRIGESISVVLLTLRPRADGTRSVPATILATPIDSPALRHQLRTFRVKQPVEAAAGLVGVVVELG
jgi:integrase